MMKGHLHRNVIGLLTMGLLTAAATIMMTACSGSGNGEVKAQETSGAGGTDIQAAFIVDRLGDNAANDESYRGIQEFEAKTGIKVTTV